MVGLDAVLVDYLDAILLKLPVCRVVDTDRLLRGQALGDCVVAIGAFRSALIPR